MLQLITVLMFNLGIVIEILALCVHVCVCCLVLSMCCMGWTGVKPRGRSIR